MNFTIIWKIPCQIAQIIYLIFIFTQHFFTFSNKNHKIMKFTFTKNFIQNQLNFRYP